MDTTKPYSTYTFLGTTMHDGQIDNFRGNGSGWEFFMEFDAERFEVRKRFPEIDGNRQPNDVANRPSVIKVGNMMCHLSHTNEDGVRATDNRIKVWVHGPIRNAKAVAAAIKNLR